MKRDRILPVITPGWIALMPAGSQYEQAGFPLRTMRAVGLKVPSSSDCLGTEPESMNPFLGISELVMRGTFKGGSNVPSEGINALDALRTYPVDSAYASFDEKQVGTLERGKLADLIVVSADPTHVDSRNLANIKVLIAIVAGSVVYEAPAWSSRH